MRFAVHRLQRVATAVDCSHDTNHRPLRGLLHVVFISNLRNRELYCINTVVPYRVVPLSTASPSLASSPWSPCSGCGLPPGHCASCCPWGCSATSARVFRSCCCRRSMSMSMSMSIPSRYTAACFLLQPRARFLVVTRANLRQRGSAARTRTGSSAGVCMMARRFFVSCLRYSNPSCCGNSTSGYMLDVGIDRQLLQTASIPAYRYNSMLCWCRKIFHVHPSSCVEVR